MKKRKTLICINLLSLNTDVNIPTVSKNKKYKTLKTYDFLSASCMPLKKKNRIWIRKQVVRIPFEDPDSYQDLFIKALWIGEYMGVGGEYIAWVHGCKQQVYPERMEELVCRICYSHFCRDAIRLYGVNCAPIDL